MIIFGIDAGTYKSGWARYDSESGRIASAGIDNNEVLLERLRSGKCQADALAYEQIRNYGKVVGAETFDTCEWNGRFREAWESGGRPEARAIPRTEVKMALCGTTTGINDSSVRQALIDKLGKPGTKKAPGPTFGLATHMWSAAAIAVTRWLNRDIPRRRTDLVRE